MEFRKGILFNKVSYVAEWLVLTLLFGLRYRVGGDSIWYEEEFSTLPSLEDYFRYGFDFYPFQPFWYILNGVIKKIWDSFFLFQIVHCSFINGVFFFVFRKYFKLPYTCVLLYFFFLYYYFATEVIRESIAIAFFALSIDSLFNRKYVKYYFVVFVAFMFHASAAILFVIPPLYVLLVKSRHLDLFIVIISVSLMAASIFIMKIIEIATGLDTVSAGKIMRYSEQAQTMNINGMLMPIIKFSVGFSILKILRRKNYYTQEKGMLILISFFLIFTLSSVVFDIIMQRFSNYMSIFFYMSLSYLIYDYIKSKKKDIIVFSVLSFSFIIQLFFLFHTSPLFTFNNTRKSYFYLYYPYHSIFDMQKDAQREKMVYCIDVNAKAENSVIK